jgi:glutamate 5-kinase
MELSLMTSNYENYLNHLANVERVVVKVGTSSLTDESSKLDVGKIAHLVSMIIKQKKAGIAPVLVSSGAIGAGLGRLEIRTRPKDMEELQAAAAIGQGILMQTYEFFFNNYGQPVAQILLTKEDFTDPCRYHNLSKTIDKLLEWGVIPIINENDTVATEEIKVGDNDTLAFYVTSGIKADLLIILTDVDGLYTGNPDESHCELVRVVDKITPEVESWASRVGKGFGGMYTKVQAAKRLAEIGIPTVIANCGEPDVISKVLTEQVGTAFLSTEA